MSRVVTCARSRAGSRPSRNRMPITACWGPGFADAMRRIDSGAARALGPADRLVAAETELGGLHVPDAARPLSTEKGMIASLSHLATAAQEKMFGRVPLVRRTHPLWLDTAEVAAQLAGWRSSGRHRILW